MEKEKSGVDARIAREQRRLKRIFSGLEPNKLKTIDALINRAAFLTVSLQDLEETLNRDGWVEEYQNGKNQTGTKRSVAADMHIALTKNLSTIMKQLVDLVPPAQRENRLKELMQR